MSSNVARLRNTSNDLSTLSNEALSRAIRAQLRMTVESMEELGRLVREARRRNMSLAEFSTGLPALLMHVADGQLDAELLLKFATRKPVLSAVIGVPLEKQRELAKGATLQVVRHDSNSGKFVTEDTTLRRLNGPQARLVFSDGKIQTPAEQRKRLTAVLDANRRHASPKGTERIRISADAKAGEIIVNAYRATPDKFIAAFKTLGYKIVKA